MDDKIDYIQKLYKRKFKKLSKTNVENLYRVDDDYFVILKHGEHFILDNLYVSNLESFPKYIDENIIMYDLSRKYF